MAARELAGSKRAREASGAAEYDTRFLVSKRHFSKQYASIYFARLQVLRGAVMARVRRAWLGGEGAPAVCERLSTLEEGQRVVIVGTLYKDMRRKPSILDEYVKKKAAAAAAAGGAAASAAAAAAGEVKAPSALFVSDDDKLILEDEAGRCPLRLLPSCGVAVRELVSGLVVAALGRENGEGEFEAEALCFPELAPQPPLPTWRAADAAPRLLALVSGLEFGRGDCDPLPLQMLVDYLTGFLGGDADAALAARVVRVVVAGNTLVDQAVEEDERFKRRRALRTRLTAPLRDVDAFLSQLASSVPVDVMPGASDPANLSLPQQPLHACLFPQTRQLASFKSVTNPVELAVDGVRVLGTSGQNVADLAAYSEAPGGALQLLGRLLRWRTLAPTAPDTLACFPFQDRDPFVLHTLPHVFFCGNAAAFATEMWEEEGARVRLVAVPSFAATRTIALVDLASADLACRSASFEPPPARRS